MQLTVTDAEGTSATTTWSIAQDDSRFAFLDCRAATNGTGTVASPYNRYSAIPVGVHANHLLYFREGTCSLLDLASADLTNPWRRADVHPSQRPTRWLAYPGEHPIVDFGFSGLADFGTGSGSLNTYADATKAWTSNQWVGYVLVPYDHDGLQFVITANTATTLTVSGTPPSGNYEIIRDPGMLVRFNGVSPYVDGIETRNSRVIGFQFGPDGHYGFVRRVDMHDNGPGGDGSNASFIMFLTGLGLQGSYFSITESRFHDNFPNRGLVSCIKLYSQNKPLVADNLFYGITNPFSGDGECFAQKATTTRLTLQGNHFWSMGNQVKVIDGNQNGNTTNPVSAEIRFNNVRAGSARALSLNQNGTAVEMYVYRNTFNGTVEVLNTSAADGTADGPFYFRDNVIETDDPLGSCVAGHPVHCPAPRDPARVQLAASPDDDVVCTLAQHCVDDDGGLTGAYTTYLGRKGWQLAGADGGAGGGAGGGDGGSSGGGAAGGGSAGGGAAGGGAAGGSGAGGGAGAPKGCGCDASGTSAWVGLAVAWLLRRSRAQRFGADRSTG